MIITACRTALLFVWTLVSSLSLAGPDAACSATRDSPCLVGDTNKRHLVSSLRDSSMILDMYSGNLAGISELRVSASSEPSEEGWQRVLNYIATRNGRPANKVIVVDLRRENHGYLNGRAITLCDKHNWLNLDKTPRDIEESERSWLQDLAAQTQIDNLLSVQQFRNENFNSGKSVIVQSVMSEHAMTNRYHMGYERLFINDHRAPPAEEVDRFINLVDRLPADRWLHLHCRGGKGRTTTFLAVYDMLKNADKATFDDILERQAAIPPYYDLKTVQREDPELTPYYQKRVEFLNEFYRYAQHRLAGYTGSWSEWETRH